MSVNLMSAIFEVEFFDLQDGAGNITKASTAKLVLLAMADHANDEGEGAYPSIEKLCRKTALSAQTIRNTFDALRYNGIIELAGKSKYGTNNHTINTKSFPKAIGKEVTVLTLYPLEGSNGYLKGSNQSPDPILPIRPESLTINETSSNLSQKTNIIPGIEAAMFAERPVTPDDLDAEAEALKAFEAALHLPGNWQWYPGKSTDEKAWKELRAFVVKLYRMEGVKAFEEYYTWSIQPFSRGAMTVLGIKRNPGDFEASWAAFKALAMLAKRTDEERGEYRPGRISA